MKISIKLGILILCCLFIEYEGLIAQIADANLKGLKYRSVGPTRGGRSSTCTGVSGEMFTFYMGTTGGGVWKTTDAGTTWKNISDKDIKVGSIGAIAVAPSDPNVIYVGTGSPDLRGNVSIGKGVYKSTDAGETWKFIGLENIGQTGKIVVHPQNPDKVWIGAMGNPFGANSDRGVFYSENGGETWDKTLYVNDKTGCVDLDIDLNNPRILYAGMWTAERKPWTFIDGSEDGGVWKSIDGGLTWNKLEGGLPTGLVGRVGISIAQSNPKVIYVIQEAKDETKGGIYRSDDAGKTFTRVSRDHNLRQRAWYYNRIFSDPQNENTLYVCNVGFHKSIDGGKTWKRIRVPHGDNHFLWINPKHTKIMIEANDGGAAVTFNGGETWSSQNNQPTSEFYRVSVDNQFPYRIYGAQQDNTTISVSSKATGNLTHTSDWVEVGGGESGHIAIHPENPDIIYAGTYIGTITRKDLSQNYRANINSYPQMHDGQAGRDIVHRFQWNAPIRISPHDPNVVYHCSQYVHRTKDGGKTWEKISPDLTTNKKEYQNIPGEPIQHDHTGVELYTTIFAFEESAKNKGELWAGTDDGRLHLSMDDGATWKEVTPKAMPFEGTINNIEISPHKEGRVYISVYKYREDNFRPYIFRTNGYGKAWVSLTNGFNGIPRDHFVRVIKEDPIRKGLLYAGTEFGMYISFDDGTTWQPFQLNLPVTPITDIVIKGNDLVLATQGRSFYVLDDVTPLRTMKEEQLEQAAHLFKPADAIRFQMAGNPSLIDPIPYGALIYFNIKDKPTKEKTIRLAILDANGKERRIFSTAPDKDKKEEKLKVHQGLNRFIWNLKYEALEKQEKSYFSLANTGGIKAPLGENTVKLTVGEQTYSQNFVIKKDPRWTQTTDDLKEQYDLAMEVKTLFNKTHTTIGKLRSVRKQIKDRLELFKQKELVIKSKEKGKNILKALNELEKKLIQTKNEAGQDPINYPSQIDDQIAYLYSVVNSLEDRPNEGAYQRFEDLKKEVQPYLDKLENIIATDLAAFNGQLKAEGIEIIMGER